MTTTTTAIRSTLPTSTSSSSSSSSSQSTHGSTLSEFCDLLTNMAASLPNQMLPPRLVPEPGLGHRRSRSRELWMSLTGNGPKSTSRDEPEDEEMKAESSPTLTLNASPSLPKCRLGVTFQCSDTSVDIPPAFYPGQAIPTILTLHLDRHSALPHAYRPVLMMSLIGTMHTPQAPSRTIICVSVSLSQGLVLWSQDARRAYENRPSEDCLVDTAKNLPGGTYSLPLTVQVPHTPRLPPTFTVVGATFAVTYRLEVTLSCRDPRRPGTKVILAEAARLFEMLPGTLPTRPPKFAPQQFYVRTDGGSPGGVIGTAKGLVRRTNSRWMVSPSLPTTTYSPTSRIPVNLMFRTPADIETPAHYQIFIRLALIRREHSSLFFRSANGSAGQIKEIEILSRYGYHDVTVPSAAYEFEVEGVLPVMTENSWTHGFSTMLNIAETDAEGDAISLSSTFYVMVTVGFLTVVPGGPTLQTVLNHPLPPPGTYVETHEGVSLSSLRRIFPGTIKTIPLPIVIGSVSEPRNALYSHRWEDIFIDESGDEPVAEMVTGRGNTCENGWLFPPPNYHEAIKVVPYV